MQMGLVIWTMVDQTYASFRMHLSSIVAAAQVGFFDCSTHCTKQCNDVRVVLGICQGFWKGVLPSLVMVCNPTVNYMLYEFLYARLSELRTRVARKVRLWISSPSAESWQNTLHVAEPGKRGRLLMH